MIRRFLGRCLGWIVCLCGVDFAGAVEPPCLGETRAAALLRSGPGLHFYPTSETAAGDRFAVIEIREDGWCAVEPPPGSFSWIHAGAVRGDGPILRVVREAAVVRVGSEFADDKAVIQTYLENGDGVRPLPPPRDADPNWLRIEPPPGEVRWLRREELGLRPFPPAPPTVAVAPPAPREVPGPPHLETAPRTMGVPAATPVAETVSRPRWVPDPLVQPAAMTEEPAVDGMDVDGAERTLRQRSELIALHERLVRMTGNPPETWDLETLQRQAQTLHDEAETAILRGEARALVRQTERLAKLRAEWKQLDATRLPAETERRLLAKIEADRIPSIRRTTAAVEPVPMPNVAPPAGPNPSAVAGTAAPEGAVRPAAEKLDPAAAGKTAGTLVRAIDPPPAPRYDVEGTLQENPLPLPGEPRFWVRAADGSNKGFVTAAPGIHLRRYLGKHVGLTGHRQDGNPRGTPHFVVRHAEEARAATAAKP